MEHNKDSDGAQSGHGISRRAVLKLIAGAPIALTFGLALSPLLRYFKPTMEPFNAFQGADLPKAAHPFEFLTSDFPEVWNCIPFEFKLAYVEFSPAGKTVRTLPSFIIRLPDKYVAYSRRCPYHKCSELLDFCTDRLEVNCGCAPGARCCCVADTPKNPFLLCRRHRSVFDLAKNCAAVHGPTFLRPRELQVCTAGDIIAVTGLQFPGIA